MSGAPPVQEHLGDLQKLARDLRSRYPSSEYYVVGLGRSPDALVTYLEVTEPGSACVVPYTDSIRELKGAELDASGRGIKFAMKGSADEAALRWLDHFFPSPEVLKGRKVVVVDYAGTGLSLANGSALIELYRRNRGLQFEHTALALGERRDSAVSKVFKQIGLGFDFLKVPPALLSVMHDKILKEWARFPMMEALPDPGSLPVNPKHEEFVQALRAALQAAGQLCTQISTAAN